jgi:hypothetical protein
MDVAYVSALSALAGSLIGGLTSGLAAWLNQRADARVRQLVHNLARREGLYKDFIIAVSTAYGESLVSNEPQIPELVALYAMISRMRVLSSPQTVICAEQIMIATTGNYAEPNKTIPELHDLIKSGAGIDPLKDFAEAAREELRAYPLQ